MEFFYVKVGGLAECLWLSPCADGVPPLTQFVDRNPQHRCFETPAWRCTNQLLLSGRTGTPATTYARPQRPVRCHGDFRKSIDLRRTALYIHATN